VRAVVWWHDALGADARAPDRFYGGVMAGVIGNFCARCGAKREGEGSFCGECGASLDLATMVVAPPTIAEVASVAIESVSVSEASDATAPDSPAYDEVGVVPAEPESAPLPALATSAALTDASLAREPESQPEPASEPETDRAESTAHAAPAAVAAAAATPAPAADPPSKVIPPLITDWQSGQEWPKAEVARQPAARQAPSTAARPGAPALPPPPSARNQLALARPSVWVMWINAALFWGVFPGIYLLYLTVRNIVWARSNKQPWLRYAMPLATLIALFVALLIWASTLPDTNGSTYP
jgi:hypothetical protein